ncbi:MAG: glycosyltransferase family 4 protein [Proteobacteria bacterium]|nr:glycosyltransferase family 4 protein [Pseudomonadota bacterium]
MDKNNSSMKHALFVAFHYPPEANSSGVLRTLKFTRYLSEFGWRVTVLTVKPSAYEVVDTTLTAQIPNDVRVVHTKYIDTKKHLAIAGRYLSILAVPDRWIGWLPWAVKAGKRLLRDEKFDLIFSTSPLGTAHLISTQLSKYSGLPLVIDFRDPWYEEPAEEGMPWINHFFAPKLEARVIKQASNIVTSTQQLRNLLLDRYPQKAKKNITCVLNGYDEADFEELPDPKRSPNDPFVLVHAGGINPEFRDPIPLFKTIHGLAKEGKIKLEKILIRFIGPGDFANSPVMEKAVKDLNMENVVEFLPRVPYKQALTELANANILLLLQASEDTIGLVPAKLYEYLRSQKPVLALVYPGATQEIMEETNAGWSVDPRDTDAMAQSFLSMYKHWQAATLDKKAASLESLVKYKRRELTGQLAEILNSSVN